MGVEFISKPKIIFKFAAARNIIVVYDNNTYKSNGLDYPSFWKIDENRHVWFKHDDGQSSWRDAEGERKDYESGEKIFADIFLEKYEEYINRELEKEVFDVNTDSK